MVCGISSAGSYRGRCAWSMFCLWCATPAISRFGHLETICRNYMRFFGIFFAGQTMASAPSPSHHEYIGVMFTIPRSSFGHGDIWPVWNEHRECTLFWNHVYLKSTWNLHNIYNEICIRCIFIHLFICLPIYLFVHLFIYLFVYLFPYIYLFMYFLKLYLFLSCLHHVFYITNVSTEELHGSEQEPSLSYTKRSNSDSACIQWIQFHVFHREETEETNVFIVFGWSVTLACLLYFYEYRFKLKVFIQFLRYFWPVRIGGLQNDVAHIIACLRMACTAPFLPWSPYGQCDVNSTYSKNYRTVYIYIYHISGMIEGLFQSFSSWIITIMN